MNDDLPLCSVKMLDPKIRESFGTRGFDRLCRIELVPIPNPVELLLEVRSFTCCAPITHTLISLLSAFSLISFIFLFFLFHLLAFVALVDL